MNLYNFKSISVVPNSNDLCDIMLSKTQRKTPTVIHKHCKISKIRSFYMRKIKTTEQNFMDRLSQIIQEFPKIDNIHPFYSSLLNIYYDKDHYKIGLSQINLARCLIHNIGKEYTRLLKFGDSLYRCKQLKRIALGKMVTVIKKQKNNLLYLEQVRQHLSRLPSINPYTRTIIICGYPNVGKSSFLNKLTRANVEVQPYPFTTKALYVGHMDYKYLRWQLIDTPGILDHNLEDRNIIEMQAITALAHLRSAVLYFIDISENCGYSIEQQINLFNNIKPLFVNKPIVIVCNKIDLINDEKDLKNKEKYIKDLFSKEVVEMKNENIQILLTSTLTGNGIDVVQEIICNTLLAYRVNNKINNKKFDDVSNKLYVAYPKVQGSPNTPNVRTPVIPLIKEETRLQKTCLKRKLERDIETEMGDSYILDLKKKYDIPDECKYDKIPEIWEGHNIIDYIQPNLFDDLKILEKEENEREALGYYSIPKIEIDDSLKSIKDIARKIRHQKIINKLVSRVKKQSTKPKLSRLSTPSIRSRSISKLKNDMNRIGVSISDLNINHLKTKRSFKRNEQSLNRQKSTTTVDDSIKNKLSKQSFKNMKKNWRRVKNKSVSESDRFIGTKKPKYLNSGKRGIGKTTRR